MIFRQLTHDDLGCASYLIGDEDAGVAAVVDPKLDIDEYLRLARYLGVRIEHILETHNHADHVSGHGRLMAATGATIHIHRDAKPAYDHEPFDDGWELELGSLKVRASHTPGHRPEHTAFALIDTARGDTPWAVLTGDSLFVGDIARPDLAVDKQEGARGIFRSLHDKLMALPATCEVWPGHLGGSLCGGPGMNMKVSSTIGYEREHQSLLQIADEDEFVTRTIATLGPQPPNFPSTRTRSTRARSSRPRPTARSSSTCAPSCSSTRRTSPARCASPPAERALAPSWRGWPQHSSRSCSSAATTRTRWRPRRSRPPSACATSPAISPAA
jgi:glyoxylase-like metal-dependent hydrolase (beta-lactamase superfamily II)